MYPIVRIFKEAFKARSMPPLGPLDTHVSQHRCWPQDIDNFLEMNNGRIMTILDLGRTGFAQRLGLFAALRNKQWGMTVAGTSVRFRKRIKPLSRFKLLTRCVSWDDKFIYFEQSIWIGQDCAAQALLRTAVTDHNGIVAPARVIQALGLQLDAPEPPDWVANWISADATRPWPPEHRPD